jgi:tetratricopeptide (TPR) repeat protein
LDIYLSYRAVNAYDEMIDLYEAMPADVKKVPIARQQLAFALNRRNEAGDRDRAIQQLESLIHDEGESAETLGILGRIYKDRYRETNADDPLIAAGWLDQAIKTYTRGFEAEPLDFYPGVNAITLLLLKGDAAALAEAERLAPLVTFAALRQGGAEADDYWTVATVIELACVNRDYDLAESCLPRALVLANEAFMPKTTADNLRLISDLRANENGIERVTLLTQALLDRTTQLEEA